MSGSEEKQNNTDWKSYISAIKKDDKLVVKFDKQKCSNDILNCIAGSAIGANGIMVKCLDQAVGAIEVNIKKCKKCVKWIENNLQPKEEGTRGNLKNEAHYKKTIVVVLESPHKKEFKEDEPLGPAMGKTGESISEQMCENILRYLVVRNVPNQETHLKYNKEISNGKYRIYLVNAIQIQCSLGLATNIAKDDILISLWEKDCVKEDFINRLKQSSPQVVINCCTDKIHKDVQTVINNNCNCLKLEGIHPSSPGFKYGFKKAE